MNLHPEWLVSEGRCTPLVASFTSAAGTSAAFLSNPVRPGLSFTPISAVQEWEDDLVFLLVQQESANN